MKYISLIIFTLFLNNEMSAEEISKELTELNRTEFNDILTKKVVGKIEWDNIDHRISDLKTVEVNGVYYLISRERANVDIRLVVSWEEFVSIFKKYPGYIQAASQTHSRHVIISLSNGTSIEAIEPKIDAIIELMKASENLSISYRTE